MYMYKNPKLTYGVAEDKLYYEEKTQSLIYQSDSRGGARYEPNREAEGKATCYVRRRSAPQKKPVFNILADWYFCNFENSPPHQEHLNNLWQYLSAHGGPIYVFLGNQIEQAHSPGHLAELATRIIPAKPATVLEITFNQLKPHYPDLTIESINILDYFVNNQLENIIGSVYLQRPDSPFTDLPVLHLQHLKGINREMFQHIMASIPADLQFGIAITGCAMSQSDDRYQLSPLFLDELLRCFSGNIQGIALSRAESILPVVGPILMRRDPRHIKQVILQANLNGYDRYRTTMEDLLAYVTHFSQTESLTFGCDAPITDSTALAQLTQLRVINIKQGYSHHLKLAKLTSALPRLEAITVNSSERGKPINLDDLLEAVAINPQIKRITLSGDSIFDKHTTTTTTRAIYPHITAFILDNVTIDSVLFVSLLTIFPNLETLIINKAIIIQLASTLAPINLSQLKHLEIYSFSDARNEWADRILRKAQQLITLKLRHVVLTTEMSHFPLLQTLHLSLTTLSEQALLGFNTLFSLTSLTFTLNTLPLSMPPIDTLCAFPALIHAHLTGSIPNNIENGILQQAPQLQYLHLNVVKLINRYYNLANLRQLQLDNLYSDNAQDLTTLLSTTSRLETLTINRADISSTITPPQITPLNYLLRITLIDPSIDENWLHHLLDAAPNLISFSCNTCVIRSNDKVATSSTVLPHLYHVTLADAKIRPGSLQRLLQRFAHTRHLNINRSATNSAILPITWINLRYFSQKHTYTPEDLVLLLANSSQLLALNIGPLYNVRTPVKLTKNLTSIIDIALEGPSEDIVGALLEKTPHLKRFSLQHMYSSTLAHPKSFPIATRQLASCHLIIWHLDEDSNYTILTTILTTQQATLQSLQVQMHNFEYKLGTLPQVNLINLQTLHLNLPKGSKNRIDKWIKTARQLQSVHLSGTCITSALITQLPRNLLTLQLHRPSQLSFTDYVNIKLRWPHARITFDNVLTEYYEPGFAICDPIPRSRHSSMSSRWSGDTRQSSTMTSGPPIRHRHSAVPFDNNFAYNASISTERQYFSASATTMALLNPNKGIVREGCADAHDTKRVEVEIKQSPLAILRATFTTLVAAKKRDEIGWYEDSICVSAENDEALTSFSERDTILEIYTSTPVKLLYCSGEARYYIRSSNPVPVSCQIAAIVQFKFCPYKINTDAVIASTAFLKDLRINSDTAGNLMLPPQFKKMPREQFINSLVAAIQNFESIKTKPNLPLPPAADNTVALCNYMLQWKIGYCRQRAWLFKLIMQAYDPSIEVQLAWNSNHMFVNMRLTKTEDLQRINLGGDGSGNFNIEMFRPLFAETETRIKEEKRSVTSSSQSTAAKILPIATEDQAAFNVEFTKFYRHSIAQLGQVEREMGERFVANILWYCQNDMQLELFEYRMENYFRSHHHSYCYIQDLADIADPIAALSELGQFLKTASKGSVLVINLTTMHLGQNGPANSILDLNRRVGSTFINPSICIVALLPEAMQHHHSADFFRRFPIEETVPSTLQSQVDPLDTLATPSVDAKALPLFHSEEALGNLLGRTVFEQGERIHQPGILQAYLPVDSKDEKAQPTEVEIALENLPLDSAEARHMVRRLLPSDRLTGQVFIAGIQHTLSPGITFTHQHQPYHFAKLNHVTAEPAMPASLALCQYVITPEHIKTFIPPHHSADEKLFYWHKTPSIFEEETGKTLVVRVRPGVYSMATWARLFASAATHDVTLRLILDKEVVIPTLTLTTKEKKSSEESKTTEPWNTATLRDAKATLQVILTAKPHLVAKQLFEAKLLEKADYYPLNPHHSAVDVIGDYAVSFNATGKRQVRWQTAAIAKKLCDGKLVVIENISADLTQELATLLAEPPYLWLNNKRQRVSGRLLILSHNAYLFSGMNCYRDEKTIEPTEPMILTSLPITTPEIKEMAVDENQRRLQMIDHALQNNPSHCVYVQGETGTGKTTSIRQYAAYYQEKNKQSLKIFIGKESLLDFLAYAKAHPSSPCMLHIDEANTLEEGELGIFESLHHPLRPGIHLQQNEFYDLQANMHFVFSGNPKSYGRHAHAFLDNHPEMVVHFTPFSKEHIQQHQYLPWLRQLIPTLTDSQYTTFITCFMNAEAFIKPHLQKALTPRNREMICLRLLLLQKKGIENAERLAVYQELEALIDEPGRAKLQQHLFTTIEYYQAQATPLQQDMVKNIAAYCVANGFYPVTSRQGVIACLLNLLELVDYRRQHPELHHMGVRGVILEGPTDGGKTQLIRLLHAAMRESKATDDELIFLDPNDPDLAKKLEEAYDQGKKLLIDESNTITNPRAYENALHFYLTDLPHSRPPAREGSFAFFAQNPAHGYKNRYSFSPALTNRLSFLTVPWFTRQDLTEIIRFLGVQASTQTEAIIKSYLDSTVAVRHRFTINKFIEKVKRLPQVTYTEAHNVSTTRSSITLSKANASVFFATPSSITTPTPPPVKKPPTVTGSLMASIRATLPYGVGN